MAEEKLKKQNSKKKRKTAMINYPIGDFIIRIKNASLANNKEFSVRTSNLIENTAELLKKKGYLEEVKKDKNMLFVKLAYRKKEPVLLGIKLVSSPGLRIYKGVSELERKKGPSTFIISTPKGVMMQDEAIKKRLGGEVIAEIW